MISGGFGERGIEGKIAAAGYAREHQIPCLGLCLGMQTMMIEFAATSLGLSRRQLERGRPADPASGHRPHGRTKARSPRRGGTKRLGAYCAELAPRLAS